MPRHRVRWMFHTTAMVRDYTSARDALITIAGQRVLEDTWIDDPNIARRGGMTWIGDNSLELGQPIVPGAGSDRFVSRIGQGMHSIALQVEDMTATCEYTERRGVRVIQVSDTVSFCHPKDTGGVFIEWFSGEPDFDPRFGAEIPPYSFDPALAVERMAFAGAVVADPITLAPRLAELFDTEVAFSDSDTLLGTPRAGVSLVDNTLALYALPASASKELWGIDHTEPRTHVLGVLVSDLSEVLIALERLWITPVRAEEHAVVLPPEATGMVPLLITDELLPRDPRAGADGT